MSEAETASAHISERIAEPTLGAGRPKELDAARGTAAQPDSDPSDQAKCEI